MSTLPRLNWERRRTTPEERCTPCEVCGHPLSVRHHMLPFADHGESDETMQLCPYCHELVHLCCHERSSRRYRGRTLWTQYCHMARDWERADKIEGIVAHMYHLQGRGHDY